MKEKDEMMGTTIQIMMEDRVRMTEIFCSGNPVQFWPDRSCWKGSHPNARFVPGL